MRKSNNTSAESAASHSRQSDQRISDAGPAGGNLISGLALSRASGDLILFKLNANRTLMGTLRGFDQFMNLVIDNTVEVNGEEKNEIGMVVCPLF
ncbi:putative LSM domain, eukaryotic/archaea-type, LSM domain superfamily protein [Helianthus annuus]|nr:putative LSM domain, eukaryotic/archaea-type, LSM domain superfamily protein [Helianthus annuus]